MKKLFIGVVGLLSISAAQAEIRVINCNKLEPSDQARTIRPGYIMLDNETGEATFENWGHSLWKRDGGRSVGHRFYSNGNQTVIEWGSGSEVILTQVTESRYTYSFNGKLSKRLCSERL